VRQRGKEVVVKKYTNRRLYDTAESRYITLDELAETIRQGKDVRVVDAKTNDDLTQQTLTQLILESRRASRLLPVPLLVQLIRMSDDALAEFFGRYMTWALELYQQARTGANAMAPYNPFATLPFAATNALARFFTNATPWAEGWREPPPQSPPQSPPPPPPPAPSAAAPAEPPPDDEGEDAAPPPEPRAPRAEARDGDVTTDELATLRRELDALKRALLDRDRPEPR
jgi:polyhydroxyalkanoate synthesis repressor PhaR